MLHFESLANMSKFILSLPVPTNPRRVGSIHPFSRAPQKFEILPRRACAMRGGSGGKEGALPDLAIGRLGAGGGDWGGGGADTPKANLGRVQWSPFFLIIKLSGPNNIKAGCLS